MSTLAVEKRLMPKIREIEGGCWIWIGKKQSNGQPKPVVHKGENRSLRPLLIEIVYGARHTHEQFKPSCKTADCVNPDHMYPIGGDMYDRVFRYVRKSENGCWIFDRKIDPAGYGIISWKRKNWRAHRASYTVCIGEIPKGMMVLHKCDVTACVNPDHLFLGNALKNAEDRNMKGRQSRGEKVFTAIMTEPKVREARRRHSLGETGLSLGRFFGLTNSGISSILNGRTWKHVI